MFRTLTQDGGVDLPTAASFVAGHSLGEYSALVCRGRRSISSTTAKLLKLRGQAMQRAVPVGRGRWRRCSAPTSALAQTIADAAAQGEVCTVANDNDPARW